MRKYFYILLIAVLVTPVVVPIIARAADTSPVSNYEFLAPIYDESGNKVSTDLVPYLQAMYRLIISLSAVLAVLVIMYGGILYMSTDAIGGKKEGKAVIQRALWGLLLVIASWLILYTINPEIVNLNVLNDAINQSDAAKTPVTPPPASGTTGP
jgi:hypothetical protein